MSGTTVGIKGKLEHGTQRRIAKQLGLSEGYVSEVVTGNHNPRTERGRKTQRRVQIAIARVLGERVDEVFPAKVA